MLEYTTATIVSCDLPLHAVAYRRCSHGRTHTLHPAAARRACQMTLARITYTTAETPLITRRPSGLRWVGFWRALAVLLMGRGGVAHAPSACHLAPLFPCTTLHRLCPSILPPGAGPTLPHFRRESAAGTNVTGSRQIRERPGGLHRRPALCSDYICLNSCRCHHCHSCPSTDCESQQIPPGRK